MIVNQRLRKPFFIAMGLGAFVILVIICVYASTSADSKRFTDECFKSSVDTNNSTLELVHIVFRHGARTPVDTYPNDPYVKDSFRPTGWGHVTNKGKRELYELGKCLQKRYNKLLQPFYSPDLVYAQATASPRALMTLSTVLSSMFPPHGTPMEWSQKLNWQPIPIFSEPLDQDSLLLVRTSCPRYFEALEEVLQLPEVKEELAQYESLFRNLSMLTGSKIRTAEDVNSLYITLEAERAFGLPLPSWTQDYFPHSMQFLAEQSYIYNAYTTEMQKIKGGPFLKKMFNEMQQKRKGTLQPNNRKLFIYTGHDWTVGNILSALKVWERQMPRFAVMAVFELHKSKTNGEYYVEIFLRNNELGYLKQLKVPNCDLKCPLDKLIELSSAVLPNEPYEERCKAKNTNFAEPPPRPIDQ
ncbi:prostatic acid phosphatase-like [Teleopsis dalmanni]|uniref:prostatic acid phosphatase-like n=1 Tax=Teleopsis dalmanni TaxID=139649 RepID=UPI0018CF08FC|nr:prostatic acid phosphatase-like [Teleopsis dalmanni]XP_037939593.1 prostatic acid phosphatase-like [Teleopsis dalmanni]